MLFLISNGGEIETFNTIAFGYEQDISFQIGILNFSFSWCFFVFPFPLNHSAIKSVAASKSA